MKRLLEATAIVGEIMVLIGAVLWMPMTTPGSYVFTAGSFMLAVGRWWGTDGDVAKASDRFSTVQLRRLYRQRIIGVVFLLIASALIYINNGFYWGYYIRRSFWLLPFVVFVVIELYTAFRIPAVEKTGNK